MSSKDRVQAFVLGALYFAFVQIVVYPYEEPRTKKLSQKGSVIPSEAQWSRGIYFVSRLFAALISRCARVARVALEV